MHLKSHTSVVIHGLHGIYTNKKPWESDHTVIIIINLHFTSEETEAQKFSQG